MKTISYINTNIFDNTKQIISNKDKGSTIIVPHVCNNLGVFGGGFAAQLGNKYPVVKQNFELLGNKIPLGKVQYITIATENTYKHHIIVANMVAQNGIIGTSNRRPLNYEALVKSMCAVRQFILDFNKTHDTRTEIHCPKFGSGLAGGNWQFIENLIQDIWSDIPIYVYILKKHKNATRY
jgi:hypothetical protein